MPILRYRCVASDITDSEANYAPLKLARALLQEGPRTLLEVCCGARLALHLAFQVELFFVGIVEISQ
jgi:hypothetical protein